MHEKRDVTVSYMGKYQDCFDSVAQLVRAMHRKCRATGTGSISAEDLYSVVAFFAAKSFEA